MLICELCFKGSHMGCLTPPLEEILVRKWVCLLCTKEISKIL